MLDDIKAALNKRAQEKAAIQARIAPLRAEYDRLSREADAIEAKKRALAEQFHALERPALVDLDNQMSALARALGGKRLSDAA